MRYAQLRAFHHVALHGGFSRAAQVLNITQPAVSDQVRKLEQAYDVLLFTRDRKQVQLTSTGEQLLLRTRRLFEQEEHIADFLSASRASIDGSLRVIVDSALHFTDLLNAFRDRHPEVFVTIRSGNSDSVLKTLRSYDAEIGIVGSLNPGVDLVAHELGASPIMAFATHSFFPDRPAELSLRALSKMPLVFREEGSRTRRALEEEATRQKIKLNPVVEVEGREALRQVVASGAGVGFVSEAEFVHDTRLTRIPLKGTNLMMSETLVYLKQRRDLRVIRAFENLIRDFARATDTEVRRDS